MNIAVRVNKDLLTKAFFYFFLITGYLNTILRATPESDITVFRLLLPVAFFVYCYTFTSAAIRCCSIIGVLLVYGVVCSLFISTFENFEIVYFLHYATIIFVASLTVSLVDRFGVASLYSHLRLVYKIMIALAIFQFFTEFEFPNTDYLGTINIYYWVDNDFGAALASFIPFLLLAPEKRVTNTILVALGIGIIAYNGSRIALLSLILFILFSTLNRLKWLGYAIAAIVGIGLFFYFKNYKLGGDTLSQLLVDPLIRIITLTPYAEAGSIYDRTNALIFGIKELISTQGAGIGPGNATNMLQMPEYQLISAQSMHNFIAQIFVEYGWLMLLLVLHSLVLAYNYRRRLGIPARQDHKLYVYLLAAILASLSQSEGMFSNYYFFVSLLTSIAYMGNRSALLDRSSTK